MGEMAGRIKTVRKMLYDDLTKVNPQVWTLSTIPSAYPIPYTLYPAIPYTLYLIPYTLYPIPYTLYPLPYTLYPILYTLKLQTLNPKPYTPNSQLSTLKS